MSRGDRASVHALRGAGDRDARIYNLPVKIFQPIFQALNHSGVRYVVVGGVAVVLQGHARLTVDLDLIVDLAADASIPDLIELKRQAGRSQDLADIERLEQILENREESR